MYENQSDTSSAIAGIFALIFLLFWLLIKVGVRVFVCWILYSCFKRLPKEFRTQEPGLVWLLLIPVFNLIWNFFTFPALANGYKNYFKSVGRSNVDDCGYGIGLTYCICACCSVFYYLAFLSPILFFIVGFVLFPIFIILGILSALASLVFLIVFLVKAWNLRGQIPPEAATPQGAAQGDAPASTS
ncbi:MAG TPA: hypothetical protein VMG59_03845 [Phycisphaerae bacterium]|nr:hypothetical protein [Phycisphaerae bacterium]